MSSSWSMRWTWQVEEFGTTSCGFKNVNIFLDYQTHYVRLAGPIAEDPVIVQWWAEATERAFQRHLEHLKRLRDAMASTQRTISNMTSGNCGTLQREASARANTDLHAIAERLGMTVYLDP